MPRRSGKMPRRSGKMHRRSATSPHLIATSPHLIAICLVFSSVLVLFCLGNKDYSLSLASAISPMMTKRLFMVHESIVMVLLCLIIVVELVLCLVPIMFFREEMVIMG